MMCWWADGLMGLAQQFENLKICQFENVLTRHWLTHRIRNFVPFAHTLASVTPLRYVLRFTPVVKPDASAYLDGIFKLAHFQIHQHIIHQHIST